MKITEKDIHYGIAESTGQTGSYYQNIFLRGTATCIGDLITRTAGPYSPIYESYQILVPNTPENREYPRIRHCFVPGQICDDSQDEFITLSFDNLEDFLNFYNLEMEAHNAEKTL